MGAGDRRKKDDDMQPCKRHGYETFSACYECQHNADPDAPTDARDEPRDESRDVYYLAVLQGRASRFTAGPRGPRRAVRAPRATLRPSWPVRRRGGAR